MVEEEQAENLHHIFNVVNGEFDGDVVEEVVIEEGRHDYELKADHSNEATYMIQTDDDGQIYVAQSLEIMGMDPLSFRSEELQHHQFQENTRGTRGLSPSIISKHIDQVMSGVIRKSAKGSKTKQKQMDPSQCLELLDTDSTTFQSEESTPQISIPPSTVQEARETKEISKLSPTICKQIDEVMEEVIKKYAATVTEEELIEYRKRLQMSRENRLERIRSNNRERDPMTLPFQYAGQTFNVQSQKLILNSLHFLKVHKKDHYLSSIRAPQDKAAKVLNISPSVIAKIRRNWRNGKLVVPGQKRKMAKRVLDSVSPSGEETIRRIIRELHDTTRETPSIPSIMSAVKGEIDFKGSRTSFRRILNRMGFKYGKKDKKIVLMDTEGKTLPSIPEKEKVIPLHRIPIRKTKKPRSQKTVPAMEDPTHSVEQQIPMDEPLEVIVPTTNIPITLQLQPNSDSILIETDSGLPPGEYVFEVVGQNIVFRLVENESMEAE